MIKSVEIFNFQSHKHSLFEFSPYVNNIIGSSNSGKTAVLRAINWVINNRPSGEAMVSNFNRDSKGNQKEDTKVTVVTDNHTISRVRSKQGNYYVLDGKTLEAIGMDVPDEIRDALNMGEVNIQSQMDAPFLISNTPGEVARFLNKIVQLDKIDVYLSAIGTKKHKTKAELELAKTNLKNVEEDLKRFNWVVDAGQIIENLEQLTKKVETYTKEFETLKSDVITYNEQKGILSRTEILSKCDSIIKNIADLSTQNERVTTSKSTLSRLLGEYTTYKNILDTTKYIDTATNLTNRINELVSVCNQLKTNVEALKDNITEYVKFKSIIESDVDIAYAEKIVRKITSITDTTRTLSQDKSNLEREIWTYRENKGVLETAETTFQKLQKELPAQCPICGSDLSNNNHMEH